MCMLCLGAAIFLRSDMHAEFRSGPSLDLIYMLSLGAAFSLDLCMLSFKVQPFLGSAFMLSLGSALFSCWVVYGLL